MTTRSKSPTADEGNETMDPVQRPTKMGMSTRSAYDLDLRDVRGQIGARRALEIAAAGGHNVLMIGPPGCGKTMLAKRLPGLLPAVDGDTECAFCAPHHTISAMAMLDGAGEVPQPGEVSRADGGVLFLDELPEFSGAVLDGLREPLEHGAIRLRRAAGSTTLPARFQLVAAMEPCPCGECDERRGIRRCTAQQMALYHARVAGTVGEHLHVVVEMGRGPAEGDALEGEASAPVRARVAQAQRTQRQRWVTLNQDVAAEALREGALLSPGGERLLGTAQEKRHLSQRSAETVLRVARTIADLARSEQVGAEHVAEAAGYQRVDLDASCAERRAPSGAAAGARTPEPQRGEDTKYYYYVSRSPGASPSYAVFVCDHAYDCEPLCQEASEQEVVALIGADALRAAQDECTCNGLGSKRLLV